MLKINNCRINGFFSCCSVMLDNIIHFYNNNKCLPVEIDAIDVFNWYKKDKDDGDIRCEYFEDCNSIKIDISYTVLKNVSYRHDYQFVNYKSLDYKKITPFINKYFNPNENIKNIVTNIEKKYNILEYDNICVLFYRGNDKCTEIKLCSYEEYIEKAKQIQEKNKNIIFLIQSDETDFIEKMITIFPNSFYFKDEIRHIKSHRGRGGQVDIIYKEQNNIYSKYYLSITIIMSKCKYIVCNSGNCSIWIALYRGNSDNIIQNVADRDIHTEEIIYNKWY